ncbi:hypothetical protein YL84_002640 [Salmonella enterica subsp. enterica]|nr:hypothetical protein [Salmonella enterica subsp. enterica serovar Infantis]EBY6675424.1 hypothetical protein [Salmonella enterica subsp. enterica serovar Saphra]ECB1143466.1 hypothetical protein [Salmonella enterica subsp. enterica serovar Saphra]EDV1282837.1 hypothetical protein [Salmonella enterica subsp. enterica]EEI1306245.1 hypothetical protein [Salmonella enterica]
MNGLSRPPVVNQVRDILFFFPNKEIFKQRPKPCQKNRLDIQGADHARKRLLSLLELRRI